MYVQGCVANWPLFFWYLFQFPFARRTWSDYHLLSQSPHCRTTQTQFVTTYRVCEPIYTACYLISNVLCLTIKCIFRYIIMLSLLVSSITHILLILSIHAIERIKLRSFIDQRLRLLYMSTVPYKKWLKETYITSISSTYEIKE